MPNAYNPRPCWKGKTMLLCIPDVLSPQEIEMLVGKLQLAEGWEDGKRSAGSMAAQVKNNRQWVQSGVIGSKESFSERHQIGSVAEPDFRFKSELTAAVSLSDFVLRKIQNHPEFVSATLPKSILPPKFNAYTKGEFYGLHVDSAFMHHPVLNESIRCDVSATLFLSDPESYDGGELQIETCFGVQSIKLAAGSVVLYPSSSLHQVTPVTRGERLASFFWVQSRVRDEAMRTTLFDLDQTIQNLRILTSVPQAECLRLTGVYHNLLRQFAE